MESSKSSNKYDFFSGASSSNPSLSRKGSLNLDRFNFSLSSTDEKYGHHAGAESGGAVSKIPMTSEARSENQSLLGAVEPLDWLFSADSEPEPPSSPKWVNKSNLTDDDSKQESTSASASKGAIPKRPRILAPKWETADTTTSNEDLNKDDDYDKARFNRKTQRRRPPTPPTGSSTSGPTTTSAATSGSHADVVTASNDLRQRILEILGKSELVIILLL